MMKFPLENECRICERIFCCEKCRARHERKKHPIEIDNLELIESQCFICNEKPLPFDPNRISADVFAHIVKKHFPLYCRKCSKMYWTERDLLENWKCKIPNLPCNLEPGICAVGEIISPKDSDISHSMAVSTQTTPSLFKMDTNKTGSIITPITSSISAGTQPKMSSVNGSLMEHSSCKNSSTFNTPAQLTSNLTSDGGKLVRTTSTPMQQTVTKPKEQHFHSASHVSSIHASSSESDVSPPTDNCVNNLSSGKIHGKPTRTRGRGKTPALATPLRQVMSKSIQRAIAEHGTINLRDKGLQPKKIFDSLSGSFTPPLDLRTSPVLRRTQSEIVERSSLYEEFYTSRTSSRKHVISTTKHIITEDVIISSNSNYEKLETVYETCQSMGASPLHSKNEVKSLQLSPSTVENVAPVSPKVSEQINKKLTPRNSSKNNSCGSHYDDDVFYTPKSLAPRRSLTSPNLRSDIEDESAFCAPVKSTQSFPKQSSTKEKQHNEENTKPINRGRFWSIVSSVMRLASFGSSSDSPEESNGLIKRCASFGGVITKTVSNGDEENTQQVKRKRTNTFDAHSTVSPGSSSERKLLEGPSKKIKRIQGRRPIERMRNMI